MARILAAVVQYFPETDYIESFRNDVDAVMIIDNTHNNIGIAAALNKALQRAIDENYDWLLTMDQDSFFTPGSIDELKSVAFSSDAAIVSPYHRTQKSRQEKSRTSNVRIAMSSGCLLRVSACKQAGFFEEKLFIDSVDNEYCLRLKKLGFRIIRANQAVLEHSLGTIQDHGFFRAIEHPAPRRYYITRNMLYVMLRYPGDFFLFGMKELVKSFFLIVFFENDKGKKLHYMTKGIVDFARGRYGPF